MLCGLGALLLSACAVAPMQAWEPAAAAAQVDGWEVSGRYGWLPDQKSLRFGPWATGPRERTRSRQTEPLCRPEPCRTWSPARLQASWEQMQLSTTQALAFVQQGPGGARAEVHAAAQLDEVQRRQWSLVWGEVTASRAWRDQFSGWVEPQSAEGGPAPAWRFLVAFDRDLDPELSDLGYADSQDGRAWVIQPLRGLKGAKADSRATAWMASLPTGYRLLRRADGAWVASVATQSDGQGRVWLNPQLPPDEQLVASALASALLLQSRGH